MKIGLTEKPSHPSPQSSEVLEYSLAGESLIFNADETNAWNARLQQLMRAAQSLGPGGSQFIINAANPMYDEEDGDDGDSPFGRMTATIEEVEGEDSSDDEPHDDELYVEEDETVMEESREAWRALRICLVFYVFFQPSQ